MPPALPQPFDGGPQCGLCDTQPGGGGHDCHGCEQIAICRAYVVTHRIGCLRKGPREKRTGKPWWKKRLENSIKEWRGDLGRVEEIRRQTQVSGRVRDRLDRKYHIVERGTLAVSTMLTSMTTATWDETF
ncbi:hypothetical protein Ahia01_001283800 [Argonauta hians]